MRVLPYLFLLAWVTFSSGCATPNERGGTVTKNSETGGFLKLPNGTKRAIVKEVVPDYPAELRKARIGGVVIARLTIRSDGTIHHVEIVSAPHHGLAVAARTAAQKWLFEPTDGPADRGTIIQVPITFKVAE